MKKKPKRIAIGEKYYPAIPCRWLDPALRLPGKTALVAILIWRICNLKKSKTVKLSRKWQDVYGGCGATTRRALDRLEEAGLIRVKRSQGHSPIVTILEHPAPENKAGN